MSARPATFIVSRDFRALVKRLCVFCGSATGVDDEYRTAAHDFGKLIAGHGIELVFGGGHIDLMGVVADAVLEAGGTAIGVIPQSLVDKELAHTGLNQLHVVKSMHERKARMADLSDGFVALPGGYGTCDELFEIITWAQLHLHSKPVGLLNVAGYFDKLLAWLDDTVRLGFIRPDHRRLLLASSDANELLTSLVQYQAPEHEPKWLNSTER